MSDEWFGKDFEPGGSGLKEILSWYLLAGERTTMRHLSQECRFLGLVSNPSPFEYESKVLSILRLCLECALSGDCE
jgi:hypothetical protein